MLFVLTPEAYPEPSQKSKVKLFTKIVNSWKPLTIFLKDSIVDVQLFKTSLHSSSHVQNWYQENGLKYEICLKSAIKPSEQNRKDKSITVNKHRLKVHNCDNWLGVRISLLGKNCLY